MANKPPYTYEKEFPKRVLESNIVKADGTSVTFDFNHFFNKPENMAINKFIDPEWFMFATVIKSPCDMTITMNFAYCRLWSVYGKF